MNQTKRGEESYKEFQRFKEHEQRIKEEFKNHQSQYADFLRGQVRNKNDQTKFEEESHKPNHIYLGKYKLHRNSSLPMVPGINSSPLKKPDLNKTNGENFRKFKRNNMSLHSSMEIDMGKSGFDNSQVELINAKMSSK